MSVETSTLIRLREAAALEALVPRPSTTLPLGVDELVEAMPQREATRYYEDREISAGWLEKAAHVCFQVDRALFACDSSASPLRLVAFVRRVNRWTPGVYEYSEQGWAPVAIDRPIDLSLVVLQPEFAESSVILLAMGSLEATDNSHHHRRLLSRAGAALEACWLSAVGNGYDGSIFAGFIPSALRSVGLIDGYEHIQLLALAVGISTRTKAVRNELD